MPRISPQAIVDPAAELADDVRIGAFTRVGPGVRISPGCVIENNVTLTGRTTLGENVHVFPLAVIGVSAESANSAGQCLIESDNIIREQVTIYSGLRDQTPTVIGDDNLMMIATHVGPGANIGDHGIFANCTQIDAGARIGHYVRTSAFSIVKCGVRLGEYTFVGGYAVVDRDAPPFAMLQGCPYRIRGVNTHNLSRCGFTGEDIRALKRTFRELFDQTGLGANTEALGRLSRQKNSNQHIERLLEAIRDGAGTHQDQDTRK